MPPPLAPHGHSSLPVPKHRFPGLALSWFLLSELTMLPNGYDFSAPPELGRTWKKPRVAS